MDDLTWLLSTVENPLGTESSIKICTKTVDTK